MRVSPPYRGRRAPLLAVGHRLLSTRLLLGAGEGMGESGDTATYTIVDTVRPMGHMGNGDGTLGGGRRRNI